MDLFKYYNDFGISKDTYDKACSVIGGLGERFAKIDEVAEICQMKVIAAMQKNRVSEACLLGTTGYGYSDIGRDTLEAVYADIFHTEDALVRSQITCGTHALSLALAGNLRPGDVLYCPTGKPYDTLEEVIGIRESAGSLKEYGIRYIQTDLLADGAFDYPEIERVLKSEPSIRLAEIQRSKGYQTRPTFSVDQIGQLIEFIKNIRPDIICMVDNCYGEFTEEKEPSDAGADMVVGSLIKNPGGGLAPLGGYIAGTRECVERCAVRLTSPGLGKEVGASLNVLPSFYQGLFLAPSVTAGAVKGAIFAASLFEKEGFEVHPSSEAKRHDIIQAVTFNDPDKLIAFCRGIQSAAPVDAHVTPEPSDMPGYESQVIMAAGAFVSGSSIELSADGPLREPYTAFFQGGLTWSHAKLGIMKAFEEVMKSTK